MYSQLGLPADRLVVLRVRPGRVGRGSRACAPPGRCARARRNGDVTRICFQKLFQLAFRERLLVGRQSAESRGAERAARRCASDPGAARAVRPARAAGTACSTPGQCRCAQPAHCGNACLRRGSLPTKLQFRFRGRSCYDGTCMYIYDAFCEHCSVSNILTMYRDHPV